MTTYSPVVPDVIKAGIFAFQRGIDICANEAARANGDMHAYPSGLAENSRQASHKMILPPEAFNPDDKAHFELNNK